MISLENFIESIISIIPDDQKSYKTEVREMMLKDKIKTESIMRSPEATDYLESRVKARADLPNLLERAYVLSDLDIISTIRLEEIYYKLINIIEMVEPRVGSLKDENYAVYLSLKRNIKNLVSED